ncbi:hypothetical protein QQS21_001835 [Conoideocrella luteorostrata]|uniref:Uncharacterized protein n=1 Tax=Conoideocrella luteorostrata TaxID=1105319 RepID=A0AAJ0G1K9_9HYPO|nr:hypothetical protein QQS21_001835 [Conoideocrella luteorostrata]
MFDESSGQVYTEWTVPRQSLSLRGGDRDWSRRRRYPLLNPRGTKGPRSLIDMATHVVANNIGDISEDYLNAVPVRLWWRIWRFLESRGICLHAWKLLSKLLAADTEDQPLGLYRFRQHICSPADGLKLYTQPLQSLATDFISHLVISGGCRFGTHELLCLSEMKNLGVLELIQPADELHAQFPDVSDRLLRSWAESENPFPLLRILRVRVDSHITQDSLRWVSKFPSLVLYDVKAARSDWKEPLESALRHSWEMVESVGNVEVSLLRYLMLFAPLKQTEVSEIRNLDRRVDADLTSLCSDSRCAVKLVANGKAPRLLDYLTDTAKAYMPTWDIDAALKGAESCHEMVFETWAFWLYSLIGQLGGDGDLRSRGVEVDAQAVAGPFVLPSKPFACVFLGHSGRGGIINAPSYVSRGLFSTRRMTFTRPWIISGMEVPAPSQKMARKANNVGSSERTGPSLRNKKRKKLDDILRSLVK